MIIDSISDLHGNYPPLEGGDLLILAGDYTKRDKLSEWNEFYKWLADQTYKLKVYIGGNHDNFLESCIPSQMARQIDPDYPKDIEYLCDSGVEFEGLKIWGSPWIRSFPDMNRACKAFTVDTEEELQKKWDLIPSDVDILITHSPPYGVLDTTIRKECVGSKSLQMELFRRLETKLFVCGHIHESYGIEPPGGFIKRAVNASHVNENYEPVNKPIRIIL